MSNHVIKSGEIIPQETRKLISGRYRTVTRAINREFYKSDSETMHSLYVGSYGRGTAVDTSDIDILVELPRSEYDRYDILKGNGQSRLLQAVKVAIQTSYSTSDIRADGQVVKIAFSDGMKFEILPAFRQIDYFGNTTYVYPDSNMGGKWRSTDPKSEQDAMRQKNDSSNGLLNDTCKYFRRIRDNYYSSYHLSGIVIDSFIYTAMGGWRWLNGGETSTSAVGTYEQVLMDFYNSHAVWGILNISAPGSNQTVDTASSIECLEKVLRYIAE